MKKSGRYFCGFRSPDLGLVWGRPIYEKVSLWTDLQAQKTYMAISDGLRPLWLSEGSTCHFWPKKYKVYYFGRISKVMYGMLDMAIWLLETENTHPKRRFEALSFLDFRKSEKI